MTTERILSLHLQKLGARGGSTRAKNLTPEERSASARRAAQALWAKRRSAT